MAGRCAVNVAALERTSRQLGVRSRLRNGQNALRKAGPGCIAKLMVARQCTPKPRWSWLQGRLTRCQVWLEPPACRSGSQAFEVISAWGIHQKVGCIRRRLRGMSCFKKHLRHLSGGRKLRATLLACSGLGATCSLHGAAAPLATFARSSMVGSVNTACARGTEDGHVCY